MEDREEMVGYAERDAELDDPSVGFCKRSCGKFRFYVKDVCSLRTRYHNPRKRHAVRKYACCWKPSSPFRMRFIRMSDSIFFYHFFLFLIFAQSVFLAASDDKGTGELGSGAYDSADTFFTVLFTVEMVVKLIAEGVFFGPFAYGKDPWHYLDIFCLTFGWLKFLFGKNYMAVFRTLRLITPLSKVEFIHGLDVITRCLIASVGQLLEVIGVLVYFFLFFSLIGLQLYMGLLENRCYNKISGNWEQTLYQFAPEALCSMGNYGRQCDKAQGFACTNFYANPWYNAISYDNIGTSLLSTFVIVSRDGWTRIAYYIDDVSMGVSRVYIIIIVLVGNLFLMNLLMALITLRFDKERTALSIVIAERDAKERELIEGIKAEAELQRKQMEDELRQLVESGAEITDEARDKLVMLQKNSTSFSTRILEKRWWQLLIVVATIGNLALLCINEYNPGPGRKAALFSGHIALTAIFCIEMFLKMHSLGIRLWWITGYNRFEFVLTLMLCLEYMSRSDDSSNLGIFGALSSLRFILLMDFMRSWEPMELILNAILRSFRDIVPVLVLVIFYIYIFAVVLMQQLASTFDEANEMYLRPLRSTQKRWPAFSNFWWSCLSVFQIMTAENWFQMMYTAVGYAGWFQAVLFVIVYIFGNIVLLAFLTAVMLGNFAVVADEIIARKQKDSEKKADGEEAKLEGLPLLMSDLKRCFIKICCLSKKLAPATKLKPQTSMDVYRVNKQIDEDVQERALPVEEPNFAFTFVSVHQIGREEDEQARHETRRAEAAAKDRALLSAADKVDLYGISCFVLWPTHRIRLKTSNLLNHRLYWLISTGFVLLGVVLLAAREPSTKPGSNLKYLFDTGDILMGAGFLFEFILKWISLGLYGHKGSYFSNPWHYLDFSIVVAHIAQFLVNVFSDSDLLWRIFQSLIAIRALRVLTAFEATKKVLMAVMVTMPSFLKIVILAGLLYTVFGVIGIALFAGKFRRCTRSDGLVDYMVDQVFCNGTIGNWVNPIEGNFDDIAGALRTLYQVSTTDGWTEVMFLAIDATPIGKAPKVNYNAPIALFFFVFILISAFFIVSIFVALVVFTYMRLAADSSSDDVDQVNKHWLKSWRQLLEIVPKRRSTDTIHESQLRTNFFFAVQSTAWEVVLAVLIVLNTVSMCMDMHAASDEYEYVLTIINICFLFIFTVELLIRYYALASARFWGDPWNILDVTLVALSIAGFLIEYLEIEIGFRPRLLRVPRMIRMLRLTRIIKRLQPLAKTIISSLNQLLQICVLLLVLLIMYAYMGMIFFGRVARQKYLGRHASFESFGSALQLMFSVATGEDWTTVMHECQVQEPLCVKTSDYTNTCGWPTIALIFFISFSMLSTFLFLNLFVAVFLSNFKSSSDLLPNPLTPADCRAITEIWSSTDNKQSWMAMNLEEFTNFVEDLPLPFGLETWNDEPEVNSKREVIDLWDFFEECPIPVRTFTNRELSLLGVDHREREREDIPSAEVTDLYVHYADAILGLAARRFKRRFVNYDPAQINLSESLWRSLKRRYQYRFKLTPLSIVLPMNGVRAMFMLLGHWRLMKENFYRGVQLEKESIENAAREEREKDDRLEKEKNQRLREDIEKAERKRRLREEGIEVDDDDEKDEKDDSDDDADEDDEKGEGADAKEKTKKKDGSGKTAGEDKAEKKAKIPHYTDPRDAVRSLYNAQMSALLSKSEQTDVQLAQLQADIRRKQAEAGAAAQLVEAQRTYMSILSMLNDGGDDEKKRDGDNDGDDDASAGPGVSLGRRGGLRGNGTSSGAAGGSSSSNSASASSSSSTSNAAGATGGSSRRRAAAAGGVRFHVDSGSGSNGDGRSSPDDSASSLASSGISSSSTSRNDNTVSVPLNGASSGVSSSGSRGKSSDPSRRRSVTFDMSNGDDTDDDRNYNGGSRRSGRR